MKKHLNLPLICIPFVAILILFCLSPLTSHASLFQIKNNHPSCDYFLSEKTNHPSVKYSTKSAVDSLKTNLFNQLNSDFKTEPMKGKRIVIDPGHGGFETGAVQNGLIEKHHTYIYAEQLKKHLMNKGACVYMTYENPLPLFSTLSLEDRAAFAAIKNADIFLSIHFNSHDNEEIHGTETYYNEYTYKDAKNPFPTQSRDLANFIQNHLVKAVKTKNIGVKENTFHVLRNNSVPSVLVEIAFLSNSRDATKIDSASFRTNATIGISNGIENYFLTND